MAKVTKKKIEQLAHALFPRHGIKDVSNLVATIVKYRNNDGHVKIWRPEGGWSWFASPGTTVATPNVVGLKFPADYRRTGEQARDDLYRQLENATLSVMSEDEMEGAIARASSPTSHATKKKRSSKTRTSVPPGGYVEYRPLFQTERGDWIIDDRGFTALEPARRRADALSREGSPARVEERAYSHLGHLASRNVAYRSQARARHHGTHATKKKTAAQLNREIATALQGRGR